MQSSPAILTTILTTPLGDLRLRVRTGLSGLKEMPMTHDGGTIVIWQNDIFHRRSRQQHSDLQVETKQSPSPLAFQADF